MRDTVENGPNGRPARSGRQRLARCARLLVIPAAVGTLVLASCASRDDPATTAAAVAATGAGSVTTPAAAAPTASTAQAPAASPTSPVASASARKATPKPSRRSSTVRPRPRPTAPGKRTPPFPRPRPSATPTHTSAPGPAARPPVTGGMTAAEAEVLRLVNAQRASHGCGALTSNAVLLKVARAHSADMAAKGYFDHTSPDGRSPFDRMRAAGYRGNLMGENIAAGQRTPAAVMTAWMNSPGHRANILNCGYKVIGIGVATRSASPYGIYWTQDFGDR